MFSFFLYLFQGISLGLIIYYFYFFFRIKDNSTNKINAEFISVIICAKNEAHNLKQFLPKILTQDYPNYEVIVVNDKSEDDSLAVLNELQSKYARLKIIDLKENIEGLKGKKSPLTAGIIATKGELVLLTDADCVPKSNFWIQKMANHAINYEIVLGFSPYKVKDGWLNRFIQYETFHTAIQYFGFASIGKPYMGVGRNLMYRKSLFSREIMNQINDRVSGDDDLFIAKVATSKNTTYCLEEDSFMISEPMTDFKSWKQQKIRHLSTGTAYNSDIKKWLGLYAALQISFYVILFFLMIFGGFPFLFIIAKFLTQFIIFRKFGRKIKQEQLLFYLPILDVLYAIYLIYFASYALFPVKNKWS